MKLISMTDFVLDLQETESRVKGTLGSAIKYAKFLKQPLKLEMFVPCDEDGDPMNTDSIYDPRSGTGKYYPHEIERAEKKVLFEGFKYLKDCYNFPNEKTYKLILNDEIVIHIDEKNTIEDLSFSNIYHLTPKSIKQLGL
jgi:hypothetical protein